MVRYRHCPSCGRKLSLWEVLRPGFKSKDNDVKCATCGHVISKIYSTRGLMFSTSIVIYFAGMLLWKILAVESFFGYLFLAIGLLAGIVLACYYFVPLKDYGPESKPLSPS